MYKGKRKGDRLLFSTAHGLSLHHRIALGNLYSVHPETPDETLYKSLTIPISIIAFFSISKSSPFPL